MQFPEWMVEILERIEERAEKYTDEDWWAQNSVDADDVYELSSDVLEVVHQLRKFDFIPEKDGTDG